MEEEPTFPGASRRGDNNWHLHNIGTLW
jgi:hypothetical protein